MKHIYEGLRHNEILIMIYDTDNEESILTLWRLLTLSGWTRILRRKAIHSQKQIASIELLIRVR